MRAAPALALVVLLLPTVAAHVPLVGEGARDIDATRSWAFYETLAPGETDRWTFSLAQGERIHLLVAVPLEETWAPGVTVVGPSGILPIERLDRVGYEFATPYAARELWALDVPAPAGGEHTILVSGEGGRYALGFGLRESFTFVEWIAVPIAALRIHLWEGQHPALLLAPFAASLVALAFVTRVPLGSRILAALFLGSGLSTAAQMARAVWAGATGPAWGWAVTAIVALVSLALSLVAWRARRARTFSILALAGAAAWSGLLVGPALAAVLAVRRVAARASPGGRGQRS